MLFEMEIREMIGTSILVILLDKCDWVMKTKSP